MSAPTVVIDDEAAAAALWSPSQYRAPIGAWRGPLIVLTDGETWSAAEELAATLQDNRVAVILGERTGGAGCGHASGGKPITLKNSGGEMTLPDCARSRFNGNNEVSGVVPDVLTGHRPDDSDVTMASLISLRMFVGPAQYQLAGVANRELSVDHDHPLQRASHHASMNVDQFD